MQNDDLKPYLRDIEESIGDLNRQLADLNYTIGGVGPKSDSSVNLLLTQMVNLLSDIKDKANSASSVIGSAAISCFAIVAHVWHHW